MEKRWEKICISCLVIFPNLQWVQECQVQNRFMAAIGTIYFLPGTLFLLIAVGPGRMTAIWLHPAPYGSISLAGALENIKRCCTLLLQPLLIPLHLPSICLCDSIRLLHTEPSVMRTAGRTKIKNSTSPPSGTRSLEDFQYVIPSAFKRQCAHTRCPAICTQNVFSFIFMISFNFINKSHMVAPLSTALCMKF